MTFVDTLADMGKDAWDISGEGNGSVMAWVQPNGKLYDLYIGGEGRIRAGKSCREMFEGYTKAERITFGRALDTSRVTDMSSMFWHCKSLTELKLPTQFVPAKAKTKKMFAECPAGKGQKRSFLSSLFG